MDGSFLEEKSSLRCWGCLSRLNWIGTLTLSLLLKLPSRKFGILIRFAKFLFLELLCISINLSYGYVWNTVVLSGLVLLNATWNCWISYKNGYAGLLVLHLLKFFESLGHCPNVCSLRLFWRYYFGRCLPELAQLAPLLESQGRSTSYSDILHNFSVITPRCYQDVFAEFLSSHC